MTVISRENTSKRGEGLFFFFMRYVLMMLGVTLVAFAVLAAVYIFVDVPKKTLGIIALGASILAALIVSFVAGKESGSAVTGGCASLIFACIRCVLSVAFGFMPILSFRAPFELATGFLIGLLGGILGRTGEGRRKRRYR